MSKRMLIDASHPEETRVVVLDGNKVEEFDFEAASKRPLKGNIYLAKVTRVEPSLQAAFVEYGGNRQGFLAFSEIHPDYYQIPIADRQALLAQQRRMFAEDEGFERVDIATVPAQQPLPATGTEAEHAARVEEATGEPAQGGQVSPQEQPGGDEAEGESAAKGEDAAPAESEQPIFADDETVQVEIKEAPQQPASDERPRERHRRRAYKIQEVIKRRQVMLVQVVKEERGTKGAALTTFLSLAGRYCVLMPNTPRGGGISRKIISATDRRRLKSAVQSLELPEGMGLIIRTAGANRTKTEIKRDYEYLLRLWDTVRELTLKSNAPALVYEEGNIIKRAIRDLYSKDISEVLVEGEAGYRDAKDFMRMIMPSHAKNVKPYREPLPLFQRFHVETQLDAMFSPVVTLKSGGYIVINQTEALVSIDVNSGKATREHSIEETAHKTNLEAADEIGRQLRLRDLAGLIVIDFIDMEDGRNDRNVEKRLRDAVRGDRARVQIGKISQFGLLEMSRQRLRVGVVASSSVTCPHCGGTGLVRSTESAALRLLRALDEEGQAQRSSHLVVKAPSDVTIYTLNQKRREVARIEEAYDLSIAFEPQTGMIGGTFEIDRVGTRQGPPRAKSAAVSVEAGFNGGEEKEAVAEVAIEGEAAETIEAEEVEDVEESEEAEELVQAQAEQPLPEGGGHRRRRRRRRGGRGRGHEGPQMPRADVSPEQSEPREPQMPMQGSTSQTMPQQPGEGGGRRRRRRRRRGRGRQGEGLPQGQQYDAPRAQGDEPLPHGRHEPKTDISPNAPSLPQWSFESPREQTREHTPAQAERAADKKPDTQDERRREPAGESEPAGEPRKGWWQRNFKLGD